MSPVCAFLFTVGWRAGLLILLFTHALGATSSKRPWFDVDGQPQPKVARDIVDESRLGWNWAVEVESRLGENWAVA